MTKFAVSAAVLQSVVAVELKQKQSPTWTADQVKGSDLTGFLSKSFCILEKQKKNPHNTINKTQIFWIVILPLYVFS